MNSAIEQEDTQELTYLLESLNEWQLEIFERIYRGFQKRIAELETINKMVSMPDLDPSSRNAVLSMLARAVQSFERGRGESMQALENIARVVTDSGKGMERAYGQHASLQNEVTSGLANVRRDVIAIANGGGAKDLVIERLADSLVGIAGGGSGASSGARLSPKLLNVLLEPWQCQVMNGVLGVAHSAKNHSATCLAWLPALRGLGLSALNWDAEAHNETVLIEFREMPHLESLLLNTILKLPKWKHTIVCGPRNVAMVREFGIVGLNILEWKSDITRVSEYSELLRKNRGFWRQFTGKRILLYQEDTWLFNTRGIEAALPFEYCGAPWPLQYGLAPNGVGNGGFTIRCPKAMARCCATRADPFPDWIANPDIRSFWPRTANGTWLVPEDVHFCNVKANQIKVAPFEVAQHLALDSYWTTNEYSAGHKWWHSGKGRVNYFKQVRVIDGYWLQSKHDHRCGWFRAIQQLFQLPWLSFTMHGPKVSDEIKLITAIDCYEFHSPVLEPWVGVLHAPYLNPTLFTMNPMLKAQCFNGGRHPMSSDGFGESLALCKRLVVMNADEIPHLERWLKDTWGIAPPMDAWTHPIALDVGDLAGKLGLSSEYSAGLLRDWPIVQMGRQDRIFSEVYTLDTARRRQWINRMADDETMNAVRQEAEGRERTILGEVEILSLSNDDFDKTLLQSIVLIPLWAATANNSVLEIMSLNVPAFVSRLPATESVLGEDYPMLYSEPGEIEAVIDDDQRLAALMTRTRQYLEGMDKSRFTLDAFAQEAAQTVLRLG